MGKFDTHGGYFSPQGYLRVNEGGSHDENPNGGVQLGVDNQGIPNMLEENEPVYDDFVYSDNIRADAEMLKKHHIPEKFSGKLFSEIADSFVDEAAERPNDPVSNNGLNAMLVRLADAQEEQKQLQQQKELKEELSKMSPEELDALEKMLAQQEAEQEQQVSPEEAAVMQEQQAAKQQQMMQQSQMPIMANGGFIRRFGDGTPGTVVSEDGLLPEGTAMPFNVNPETGAVSGGILMRVNPETGELIDSIEPARVVAFPGKSQAWVDAEVGPRSIKKKVAEGTGQFMRDAYDVFNEAKTPLYFVPGIGTAMSVADGIHGVATGDPVEVGLALTRFAPKGSNGLASAVRNAEGAGEGTQAVADVAKKKMKPWVKKILIGLGVNTGLSAAAAGGWKAYDIWGNAPSNEVKPEYQIDSDLNDYAHGGVVRKFDKGGLSTLPRYAGMLMNGTMGLYNAFQNPDKYSVPTYKPVLPSGRLNLVAPVYNPVDEERTLNAVLAQNAGDRRALANAGLGPSTTATLLASGYNAGKNIGTARLETSAANNDRRNAIIAQRNTNAAQQAQFQSQLAAQRAQVMNQAQLQNMRNMLMMQRLNNEAEGEKYTALSGNIAAMSKDLAGIGKENFSMNSISDNPYFNYSINPDGSITFTPKQQNTGRCGGFIKRYKK